MQPDNKPQNIPSKKIDTEGTREYGEILLVKKDLEQVKQACQRLSQRLDNNGEKELDIVDYSLWNNALVIFFRCFKQGLRKYKLGKDLFKDLNGEPLKVFEYFEKLRDKHIAHPVNVFEEVQVGILFDLEKEDVVGTGHLLLSRVFEGKKQIHNLLGFVDTALNEVNRDLNEKETLLLEWARNQSTEYIENLEDIEYKVPDPMKAVKKNREQRH